MFAPVQTRKWIFKKLYGSQFRALIKKTQYQYQQRHNSISQNTTVHFLILTFYSVDKKVYKSYYLRRQTRKKFKIISIYTTQGSSVQGHVI